jgi:ABC-type uncharacterized transport system substrate-binding protein
MLAFLAPVFAHAYSGVTIVLSAPTQSNLEFVDHFKEELIATKNQQLKVTLVDLSVTDKLVVAENSELVIALGVKALTAASKLKQSTSVVGVFAPLPTFNALLASSKRDLGNFSAIVLDQPYSRQISLIRIMLPDARALGVLLGSTSAVYAENIKEETDRNALSVNVESVNIEDELIPKLKKVLDSNDALLAIPDPFIYNRETAQPILLTSYRYQKPVFGYSQSYVRAGALAAVYSSTKHLAKQAAEIAIRTQTSGLLPPPQTPKYFAVQVNQQVARSLNIPLKSEDEIYRKLLQLEIPLHAEVTR